MLVVLGNNHYRVLAGHYGVAKHCRDSIIIYVAISLLTTNVVPMYYRYKKQRFFWPISLRETRFNLYKNYAIFSSSFQRVYTYIITTSYLSSLFSDEVHFKNNTVTT